MTYLSFHLYNMRKLAFAFLIFFISKLNAQDFGGFPPSTKWQQINTDTARIIFNKETKPQAERIATIVHRMAAQQPISLGNQLRKINIVLQKNTTLANGYVALAPFRSEYYLIPSSNIFDLGNLPWYEHLAVHEYRHVQQYNNFNRGLTKAFHFVLGEEGQALSNALTVPNWFFEGDAVHAESALTLQGRGRLPFFLNGYKSLWQANKNYRLMKLLNGSLKDYVPDHYQLGYLITNYGYEKYGPEFWQQVTTDAARWKGLFYPFRKAIQHHSNLPYKDFMQAALKANREGVETKTSPGKSKTVTNYYFPQIIGQDSLLYWKDSYKKLAAFYIKDEYGEHKIKRKNIGTEEWISYRNGLVAYTAYNANARWALIDYSDIILLNTKTGGEKKLTHKRKYFTPDISPSGNSIIAVAFTDSTTTDLQLLNVSDGAVQKTVKSNGAFFLHPRFIDEENIVLGIRLADGSISLNKMNLISEQIESLTPSLFAAIGYPSVKNDTVYFTASYNNNDDVYALNLKDKKIFQLTSEQTGSYYVSSSGNELLWSQFTANGLALRTENMNQALWKEWNSSTGKSIPAYPVALAGDNILATPTRDFPITKYKKRTGLFNFHSWRPYYDDPEFTFSLYGDNILNTFGTELFYRYNQNEQSHGGGFNIDYGALFPVFTAGAEYTFNRHVTIRTPQGLKAGQLNGYELKAGYYIPLNFTGGKTAKALTFGTDYNFNQQMPIGNTKTILSSFNTSYLHHYINWTQQLPRARQHIFPKFGYAMSGSYRHRLDEEGFQALGSAQLYLPSFANHSIVLSGSFQEVDTSNVLFSNRFNNSRGYPEYYFSRMWRTSANYHFPLAYPDWGFAGIVYFLRIRSNLFYDFTKVYSATKTQTADLRSTGTELFFDTKWWNQLPVSFGLRYSYLLDADRFKLNVNQFEFTLTTDLISN